MEQYGGEDKYIGGAVGGAKCNLRKRMYIKKHCSPGESNVNGSCLDDNMILKIYWVKI